MLFELFINIITIIAAACVIHYVITIGRKERKQAQALREEESRFRTLINSIDDMVFTLDSTGRCTGVNDKWAEKMGLDESYFIGKTADEVFGSRDGRVHEEANERVSKGENVVYSWSVDSLKGIRYYQTSLSPIKNADGTITGIVGVGRDITEQKHVENRLKEANERLKDLSFIDGLTRIPNRRYFDESITREWSRAARTKRAISLLMIDIDYFKDYNDAYGHLRGDECIKTVAGIIKETLKRSGDLAARYGGEEFAVILPETDREGAVVIAQRLKRNIEEARLPHGYSGVGDFVTVSIGVASVVPESNVGWKEFIGESDRALYEAKRKGRNRFEVGEAV